MTRVVDVERAFFELCLGDGRRMASAAPGEEHCSDERQAVYRELVRNSLFGNVKRSLPVARAIVKDDGVDPIIARFLAEAGPTTRLYRDVPHELAQWLMTAHQALGVPQALAELIHWETLEVEVTLAPDVDDGLLGSTTLPASKDVRVLSHPSARLAAYWHAVHTLTKASASLPPRLDEPVLLLAWRSDERFLWRTIDGGLAKLLVELAQERPLGAALDAVVAQTQGQVDPAMLRAQLVELAHRGVLSFAR